MAAVTPHCPFIEFLPSVLTTSGLRREVVIDNLALKDGQLVLPNKPGLGIELNYDALQKYRVN
jgi:L-alanine-DL-glutamate epimerase-like enolase superfamily enzyme